MNIEIYKTYHISLAKELEFECKYYNIAKIIKAIACSCKFYITFMYILFIFVDNKIFVLNNRKFMMLNMFYIHIRKLKLNDEYIWY